MEMASSEVEISSSCPTFNCVLNPHERCNNNNHNMKNKNKNNNARNIQHAFEKNLNVFVRDHLETCNTISVPESSVSKTEESQALSSSPSLGSDLDSTISNPSQPENASRKETRAASSLVQIWEARTTQHPPPTNQSQIDNSRTSSLGTNPLENFESLNEESELIQSIEQGNNNGEEEKEKVRVMDIIRRLSTDSEMNNIENGSGSYDNSKESSLITEARCFPQVACSPRIRGRQAFADLLDRMIRDREKELACLLESRSVSKFTHRGRIQSTLRIRCYQRCIAIQSRHRCKPSSGGSDLNRSSRGSGVMNLLMREKYKTNSESIETGAASRGRVMDKESHKVVEKNGLQETTEKKSDSVVEVVKKAVLSDTSETKNGLKKFSGETIQKDNTEGRGEKREMKEKPVAKENLEGRGERRDLTKDKAIAKETTEARNEKREMKEKSTAKESLEGKGEKRELTKEKAIVKESVEGNNVMDKTKGSFIAEKVNLWNSEDKLNRRTSLEKGKTQSKDNNSTERVEKNDVVEEATRRIVEVESAERSISTSKEMMPPCDFGEKIVRRKKKEDPVSVETTKSKEINPKVAIAQAYSCLRKADAEEKVLVETTVNSVLSETADSKNGLEKPVEKDIKEERREMEESEERNSKMGIAEKVNMWNSKENKNRRRAMEKGKGKTEGKADTETNEVLKEASRRISDVETAERSITFSKETVEKVSGDKEMSDKRESSTQTTRCESEEEGRSKKDEDFCSVKGMSKEIVEDKNLNSQEVSASHGSREMTKEKNSSQHGEQMSNLRNSEAKSVKEINRNISLEARKEEESSSDTSREKAKEKISLQQAEDILALRNSSDENDTKEVEDEETKIEEREENMKETAIESVSECDENQMEEEDEYGEYDDYYGENTTDWIYDISKPRSYWEELRKERYLEVLNTESDKNGICDLIYSRTVSNFLTSELRQKIDNLMINRVHGHLEVQITQEEEEERQEWEVECSPRNQEYNETEEEPEKAILEAASDHCSQSSSWSFRDQEISNDNEATTSLSIPEPSTSATQTIQDMQTISDLRGQMEQLQREMLELRNTVKACIDMQIHFQKSIAQDLSRSGASSSEQQVDTKKDPLKRKCCVCSEMPVDSLLYRCGHMCTCLKCAHELQWSSKKCPICMAPIVDVVRAFLDS